MENAESQRPVAARVAANVRMLRNERRLDLADVSETMTALGRPLSLNGLSKVERGKRGIDVDDLLALALALDVSPLRLLLTPEAGEDQVALTAQVGTSERLAWEWATGESPLDVPEVPFIHAGRKVTPPDSRPDLQLGAHRQRAGAFRAVNRPHVEGGDWTMDEVEPYLSDLSASAVAAKAAHAAGVPWPIIHSYLDMTRNV